MSNISDKLSYSSCTGCGACVAVCPVSAIEYKLNEFGFLEAYANNSLCVGCGKCKKVCLKYLTGDATGKSIKKGETYSAQSISREVLESCTSGGIAYEIAKDAFECGYKVVGVVYNVEKKIAETIIANTSDDIERFKGSKYLQSNSASCFRDIVMRAKNESDEKYVIFGTPCQITGIKKAFRENQLNNKLLAVDLFCHGVPSYIVWEKYLDWLEVKHNVNNATSVTFRSKIVGWHDFTMDVRSIHSQYCRSSEYDIFYKAFFDNVLLNTACRRCLVRKEFSMADIRLGDFWGGRYQNNQEGISAVLVLSEQGRSAIKKLAEKKSIRIIDKTSVEECISSQSVHDYKYDEVHMYALRILKTHISLPEIIRKYRVRLPLGYRIKVLLKEMTAYMPNSVRAKIRLLYRNGANKLKGIGNSI